MPSLHVFLFIFDSIHIALFFELNIQIMISIYPCIKFQRSNSFMILCGCEFYRILLSCHPLNKYLDQDYEELTCLHFANASCFSTGQYMSAFTYATTYLCVLNHYQYHDHYKSLLLFFTAIYHTLAIATNMFSYTAIVMITVSCTLKPILGSY